MFFYFISLFKDWGYWSCLWENEDNLTERKELEMQKRDCIIIKKLP